MNVLLFRELTSSTLNELQAEFTTCTFRSTTNPEQLEAWLDWPDIVFGNAPVAPLQRAPRLRWLQIVSSGFDEYGALQHSPVTVTTGHGVHAPVIAQHVLMMFLLFARAQLHFAACQRQHRWDRRPSVPQDPAALTVGLVGYGAVGKAIAQMLRPAGPRVIATKLTATTKPSELDALHPWERLGDLLAISDHVVLALPLTADTLGLFDAARLAQLKPGAVLHNISRGQLIDENALTDLLRSGALGGAALDVFASEPLSASSPLWDMPNVIITPHLAGHHCDLGRLMLERFKHNLRRHLHDEPLQHIADFTRGY